MTGDMPWPLPARIALIDLAMSEGATLIEALAATSWDPGKAYYALISAGRTSLAHAAKALSHTPHGIVHEYRAPRPHGDRNTLKQTGCTCDPCRADRAAYQWAFRPGRIEPKALTWWWPGIEPIHQHIAETGWAPWRGYRREGPAPVDPVAVIDRHLARLRPRRSRLAPAVGIQVDELEQLRAWAVR